MKLAIATALGLAVLPGCAALLTGAAISTAGHLEDTRDTLGINVWNKEEDAYDETGRTPAGVVAPSWSYDGVSVRAASTVENLTSLCPPEIQVRTITSSGIDFRSDVDGQRIACSGVSKAGWSRFSLSPEMRKKAQSEGLSVRVTCAFAREWTFDLTPEYFRGFERKRAEIVASHTLTDKGAESAPSVERDRLKSGPPRREAE